MALINCPECSSEISDTVTACPHCGYNIQKYVVEKKYKEKWDARYQEVYNAIPQPSKPWKLAEMNKKPYIVGLFIALCVSSWFVYMYMELGCNTVLDFIVPILPFALVGLCYINGVTKHNEEKKAKDIEFQKYEEAIKNFDAYRRAEAKNAIEMEQLEEAKVKRMVDDWKNNVIRCPKCGSTNVTTGARGINATWGEIGASDTVNRCASCGHVWRP